MNRKTLHALHGLKWNPFTSDVPNEGLLATPQIESFCARVEGMVYEGGFALITGDPGNGKSVALRILADKIAELPEVTVGIGARVEPEGRQPLLDVADRHTRITGSIEPHGPMVAEGGGLSPGIRRVPGGVPAWNGRRPVSSSRPRP